MAMGLRLARFNSLIDVEKPKWQSNYFTGMPAPAGAITVLLPLYLDGLGLFDARGFPWLTAVYTLAMAVLLVSTIPTFSGKLLGERIAGDYVLPVFVGVAAGVALLLTYPYAMLALGTILYLAAIPLSYRRFESKLYEPAEQTPGSELVKLREEESIKQAPAGETKH
jgi:CDP-diacylglycerol--serine O-phosphatidyltransferase